VNWRITKDLKLTHHLKNISEELLSIFIEIDDDLPIYTLPFISDSGYKNSKEIIEEFIKKLNENNDKFSNEETFLLFINHKIDYELSYSGTKNLFYYNFGYLCDN
ncbi:MAG: hypothetical protein JJE21_04110, partial [Spirochaetaceae bacterium]|nr:hypothetical protein [Spirochaetaceae bacterium]